MASPQKETGFTPIANEILEQLAKVSLSGAQFSVVFLLLRQTYGWQRKTCDLPLSLIEQMTGIKKNRAKEIIDSLIRRKLFTVVERAVVGGRYGSKPAIYAFNKDYDTWILGRASRVRNKPVLESEINDSRVRNYAVLESEINTSPYIERKIKESCSAHEENDVAEDEAIPDLGTRVLRLLTQLQPSGLSQADRLSVAELVKNTDKSPRRVLEAVGDAVRDTQAFRREKRVQAPVRFALSVVGRILSEPEPSPHAGPTFVQAPADWVPPYERSKPQ